MPNFHPSCEMMSWINFVSSSLWKARRRKEHIIMQPTVNCLGEGFFRLKTTHFWGARNFKENMFFWERKIWDMKQICAFIIFVCWKKRHRQRAADMNCVFKGLNSSKFNMQGSFKLFAVSILGLCVMLVTPYFTCGFQSRSLAALKKSLVFQ